MTTTDLVEILRRHVQRLVGKSALVSLDQADLDRTDLRNADLRRAILQDSAAITVPVAEVTTK